MNAHMILARAILFDPPTGSPPPRVATGGPVAPVPRVPSGGMRRPERPAA